MSIQNNFPAIAPSLNLSFALTKELDPRITFTRASTATYYGTQTAKAEENLLTYSQEFDNAVWAKTNSSVTANTTVAPDGTTTADTMTASAATGFHIITAAPTSLVLSNGGGISFFAKAGTASFVQLFVGGTAVPYANFDLSTGAVSGFGAGTTASIVAAGNGWYRCQLVTTTTATNSFQIGIVTNISAARAESWTAAGTETVLIWGAQAENRQAVTAYTPTTTQPITNYIPVLQTAASGVARFDHNPVTGESLGLLIEEQRTNLLLYSEQFDNAAWGKARASIAANIATSPDGTVNADKLVEDTTASNTHFTNQSVASLTSGTAYTFTCFAKASERTWIALRFEAFNSVFTDSFAYFDLSNGTIGTVQTGITASITNIGNGWYRCSATRTAGASGTGRLAVLLASGNGGITYTGDGYSGIFLWGAQLEAGAFSTSYIKTEASQVTRAADAASMTGANFSSWYNQGQGTLYGEASPPSSNASSYALFEIGDGTLNNRIGLFKLSTSGNASLEVRVNGSQEGVTNSGAWTTSGKFAGAYRANDFASSLNAATPSTDAVGNIPVVTQALFGRRQDGANVYSGTIKKLAYYPVRVTNAQLQGLTS